MTRMRRYIYKCEECDIIFQTIHSIKEKLTDCEECDTVGVLKRIPSIPLVLSSKQGEEKRQVGSLVKEYIENVKEDLKDEKEDLSSQVYRDD